MQARPQEVTEADVALVLWASRRYRWIRRLGYGLGGRKSFVVRCLAERVSRLERRPA